MQKRNIIIIVIIIIAATSIFVTCKTKKNEPDNKKNTITKNNQKQLNISILWDLSDRINPVNFNETPSIANRDVAIIKYFADYFKEDMNKKGAYQAKNKIKIFFSPNPTNENINLLASKMDVDLSTKNIKEKKYIYDNISSNFEQTANQIIDLTIKTSKWEGSDIYRFFKNDVVDYCISKDTSYRNILVILTDGYIYHPNSIQRLANKSEFILPSMLNSLGLRDNPDFRNKFFAEKCGLISTRNDLNKLDILVLEINSEPNHKDDEDIIKLYLETWFKEMNVNSFKIYNTDLPDNTKNRIISFLME